MLVSIRSVRTVFASAFIAVMILLAASSSQSAMNADNNSAMHPIFTPLQFIQMASNLGLLETQQLHQKSAAITSGHLPLGFVVAGDSLDSNVGVLFDFNRDFTESEIAQYQGMMPLLLSLIEGTGIEPLKISTYPTRALMTNIGDAQQVHNYVINRLVHNLAAYIRIYGTKVSGREGISTRLEIYLLEDAASEMYLGAIEIPASLTGMLNNFSF